MSARGIVTFALAGDGFGIPAADVRDVLRRQQTTPVPLAPPAIAGLVNLRGRIVTAIDLRRRLGLTPPESTTGFHILVEHEGEFYALLVDAVGEVVHVAEDGIEPVPARLDPLWRVLAAGVFQDERGLSVLLDTERLFDLAPRMRATS